MNTARKRFSTATKFYAAGIAVVLVLAGRAVAIQQA